MKKNIWTKNIILFFLATLLLSSSLGLLFSKIILSHKAQVTDLQTISNDTENKSKIEEKSKFEDEKRLLIKDNISSIIKNNFNNISGNYSFAFLDLSDSNQISINNNKSISASVIKMYIMVNAFQQAKDGSIQLSDTYSLSKKDKVDGSGILNTKPNGTILNFADLINLMITESDNTATNILINRLGINSINNTIKSLGCADTSLNRLMMDQNAISSGIENYTSVNDLTMTLKKIYNNECINAQYDSHMLDILKANTNNKKIPALLPLDIEVANKTGENIGIENDAGIVFSEKGAYIICFMTSNGSSNPQVSAISKSSREIFDTYMNYKLK